MDQGVQGFWNSSRRLVACLALSFVSAHGDVIRAADLAGYAQAALTQGGNSARGSKIFFEDARAKCASCHRIDGKGGEVGPDLSKIGGKFDRPHLIESLLEPSRQIVEGFRTTIVRTRDAQTFSGIARSRLGGQLELVDAAGKAVTVRESEIEEEKIADQSIMPFGIAEVLSKAEFTDLVAYLESRRHGGQKMGAGVKGPIQLPPGFAVKTVATGLSGAVAFEVLPDGRVLVCEQTGALRVVRDGLLLSQPFLTLPVASEWERGLIGVTVDPDFTKNQFVYVCWIAKEPYVHHVISRFKAVGDVADISSELRLLEGDDQSKLGGKVPAGHQGGALHFGLDGCLYIAIGDQTAGIPAQRLDTFQGKLLRIRADGSIPDSNPLMERTQGKYQAIFAYGLRNPFTFAIHHASGEIFVNDVGGVSEEINRVIPGANFGWPTIEHGVSSDPRFTGPIHIYPQASISGGDFHPETSTWPSAYRGKYFFADFVHGWIRYLDPASARQSSLAEASTFTEGLRRPVDLRFAPDGSLFVLIRNAWVVDDKFEGKTSSVLKIDYQRP